MAAISLKFLQFRLFGEQFSLFLPGLVPRFEDLVVFAANLLFFSRFEENLCDLEQVEGRFTLVVKFQGRKSRYFAIIYLLC